VVSLVDMSALICALSRMLLEARRSWDRAELLAAVIADWKYRTSVRIGRMANRGPHDYVSATSAAHRLGVSTRTLRRYTQEGRLPDARSAGGRRIFRIADLDAITRKPPAGRAVGYARVSPRRQQAEGDLHRQVARLKEFGDADLVVFTDVASGLSDRRAGLRKALGECMKPGVDRLLVEHPDRLARFGVGVIEHLLVGYGVKVIYTGQSEDESAESELVRDMLAIVTSFAGRLYGQRSAKTKRLRAAVVAETHSGDAA
jgi:excisionase family DNA binding protein